MKKRYIIGGLIIVVGILVGFFISKNSAIAPAAPDTTGMATTTATTTITTLPVKSHASVPTILKNGEYLVTYMNSGFVPKTLTIKRGTGVRFFNYSTRAMSIIAVDQNSQTYRTLNQEQSVGKGSYYDFSFVNPGIWVYTNRNNNVDRGTIIVQ